MSFLTTSVWARGGSMDSGGGNALVCFGSADTANKIRRIKALNRTGSNYLTLWDEDSLADITSITTLDLYLHLTKNRLAFDEAYGHWEGTSDQIVTRLIENIAAKTEFGRTTLKEKSRELDFSKWVPAKGVIDSQDHKNQMLFSNNCEIVPVASRFEGTVYYDSIIVEKMSPVNRAALIMHEKMYSILLARDPKKRDSAQTQMMVGEMFTKEFLNSDAINMAKYFSGPDAYAYKDIKIGDRIYPVEIYVLYSLYESKRLESVILARDSFINFDNRELRIKKGARLTLTDEDEPKVAGISYSNKDKKSCVTKKIYNQTLCLRSIELNSLGEVTFIKINTGLSAPLIVEVGPVQKVKLYGNIYFESGKVTKGYVYNKHKILVIHNGVEYFEKGDTIYFD